MALAAVLGLTAYVALTGGDHDGPVTGQGSSTASPSPSVSPGASSQAPAPPAATSTYSIPANWTEPARWAALPRGSQTAASGNTTGFPNTTDGAVALLVAATATNMQNQRGMLDEQLAIYNTYLAAADQNPANEAKLREKASQTDAQNRADLGLPASGPLPSGAFVRANVVGFKVIQSSPSEVTAYLLTKVSSKAGEMSPENDSYVVSALGAVWQDTDWKLSVKASSDAVAQTRGQQSPTIAAPGDARFNEAGWTAIRQAS
ncbi:hypothetical protein KV557_24900 [Kitasatospora aureofaciens]|uniref:hypothetical protein n=1 Tax=Kitasatospora aureofaciens TaxID=1894 RepID=UPI001C4774EA|nr:hypothetical protein [Kitasatospora aureofaciens]MBV6700305.1 hypothetical protein [Kitasatospora aureofaciens]